MGMRSFAGLLTLSLIATACATTQPALKRDVARDISDATGAVPRLEQGDFSLPPSVEVSDGLSRDEAVAVALWNNAAFQVVVSQLGFARADVVDAGLIGNPTFSLLFPIGPKQLEATLRWPVEFFWERPRRLKAASLSFEVAGQSLVQSGLDLSMNVRLAYADLALAMDRQGLLAEASGALDRIDALTQTRLRLGDVSELEARSIHVDALRVTQDVQRAAHDVVVARERLRFLLGMPAADPSVNRLEPSPPTPACGADEDLIARARAARPDLRAAEIAIEAAAARLGWERSRVLALSGVLDANGQGLQGFELGPGIDVSIPLFNRNQGGRLRADTELRRASTAYVQLQQQIVLDVKESAALLAQARESRLAWTTEILEPLQANLTNSEEAYSSGDVPYLAVLDNVRRLIDGRVRAREIAADEQRAQARIERASGLACR